MDKVLPYYDINFSKDEPTGELCYLCAKPKKIGKLNQDHIIPWSLFYKGCENRPYLTVHKKCNSNKSLDDEKFVIRLQLMCNWRPAALADVTPFLDTANDEANDAYLVGRSKRLRNYKLKRTIAKEFTEDIQFVRGGQRLVRVALSDKHVEFMKKYSISMAYGLLKRNKPDCTAAIQSAEFIWHDYYALDLKGKLVEHLESTKQLATTAIKHGMLFGQSWEGLAEYFGMVTDKDGKGGFVYMKFYDAVGIWVNFPAK